MTSGEESAKRASLPKITPSSNRSSRPRFARSTRPGRRASAHTPSTRPTRTAAIANVLKLKIDELILLPRTEKDNAVEQNHEQYRPHPPGDCGVEVNELRAPAVSDRVCRQQNHRERHQPPGKRGPSGQRTEQGQKIRRRRSEK